MPVSDQVLGMNARNYLYIRKYNSQVAHTIADNKLLTKKALLNKDLPTSPPLVVFKSQKMLKRFDWKLLPKNGFAIKPARGYGGEGITLFTSWEGTYGMTISGKRLTIKDLQTHILDILDGKYSLQNMPDWAYVEDLIKTHPFNKRLTSSGLPDIRVIVFNKIPVMAMVRVPNEKSQGKANLMQGALALGVDLRTGITFSSYTKKGRYPRFLPGTRLKAKGIRIPNWHQLLLYASMAADACELGLGGIDMVLDGEKGHVILEVNARPGLSIQLVNRASLRTRLERVENLKPMTSERAVALAQSLFAQEFADKVDLTPKVLGTKEAVILRGKDEQVQLADINTSMDNCLIDRKLARKLKLETLDKEILVKSHKGVKKYKAVRLRYVLMGRLFKVLAGVTDLSNNENKIILGTSGVKGFLINPEKGD